MDVSFLLTEKSVFSHRYAGLFRNDKMIQQFNVEQTQRFL